MLLHGFLAISSAAPTPCQGDFSSLPLRPLSPSSPGLSPLHCCGHALDTATLRMALLPKTWPPTPPCRPSACPSAAAQGPRHCAGSTHPPAPRDLRPLTYHPYRPRYWALSPRSCTSPLYTYPQFPHLLPFPHSRPACAKPRTDPILCPVQGSPGAGRKMSPAHALYEHIPSGLTWAPAACGLCSLPSSLRHYTQNAFHLLHAPLTSSSQLTTVSHFAEKTEASHQQLPPSLGTKPTEQLRPH